MYSGIIVPVSDNIIVVSIVLAAILVPIFMIFGSLNNSLKRKQQEKAVNSAVELQESMEKLQYKSIESKIIAKSKKNISTKKEKN